MIDFVSNAPGLEPRDIKRDLRTGYIPGSQNHMISTSNLKGKAGHAKAALRSLLLPLAELNHRVDHNELPCLVLAARRVHHEDALRHSDLRCCKPNSPGAVHYFKHLTR